MTDIQLKLFILSYNVTVFGGCVARYTGCFCIYISKTLIYTDSLGDKEMAPVIGCATAMKMRLRTLLHSRRSQANAVGSYAKSMKGVTCDTSPS
jgi:hypothetical protein